MSILKCSIFFLLFSRNATLCFSANMIDTTEMSIKINYEITLSKVKQLIENNGQFGKAVKNGKTTLFKTATILNDFAAC